MPKIIDITELILRDAHQSVMATRMAEVFMGCTSKGGEGSTKSRSGTSVPGHLTYDVPVTRLGGPGKSRRDKCAQQVRMIINILF